MNDSQQNYIKCSNVTNKTSSFQEQKEGGSILQTNDTLWR